MLVEENKAGTRRAIEEFWNQGNMELLDEFWAPNYINHDPTNPEVRDLEGFKQWVIAARTAFPDLNSAFADYHRKASWYESRNYSALIGRRAERIPPVEVVRQLHTRDEITAIFLTLTYPVANIFVPYLLRALRLAYRVAVAFAVIKVAVIAFRTWSVGIAHALALERVVRIAGVRELAIDVAFACTAVSV